MSYSSAFLMHSAFNHMFQNSETEKICSAFYARDGMQLHHGHAYTARHRQAAAAHHINMGTTDE